MTDPRRAKILEHLNGHGAAPVVASPPPHTPPPRVDGFADFWSAYPRKVGKLAAQRAWTKLHLGVASLPEVLGAVTTQVASPEWRKDGGQFIPHPATWLNQGRWLDEAREARTTTAPAPGYDPEWAQDCHHEPSCSHPIKCLQLKALGR